MTQMNMNTLINTDLISILPPPPHSHSTTKTVFNLMNPDKAFRVLADKFIIGSLH